MLIGYARVSKDDGSQVLDMQLDGLRSFGVQDQHVYTDLQSGADEQRLGIKECMKALREGDTLVVYSIDRLARGMNQAIRIADELRDKNIDLKILFGAGSSIDLSTPQGRFNYNIMAAFADLWREILRQNTREGCKAAKARGRVGGRRRIINKVQLRAIIEEAKQPGSDLKEIAKQVGVTRSAISHYIYADGSLKKRGEDLLNN